LRPTPIGDVVERVRTWDPSRQSPEETFSYIDLSAVDQQSKTIVGARRIVCSEAPSRARQLVAYGDVLTSTVRPNLNAVARVPAALEGATASTGFCVLRPRPCALHGDYLFHWLKTPAFVSEMTRRATGASYPAVSDRIIQESLIPLPPIPEQRRIAALLDRADTLRAKRRAAIAQLDALAQSIFLDMFGDPMTNPKGWPSAIVGDVLQSVSDGPHVSPKYSENGIPFLSTRHVRAGEIVWEDLKFISSEDAEVQWRKCKPTPGDILYTKGGTTGLAAVVTISEPFAVWVHVALLRPDASKIDASWLEAMLNSEYCYRQSQVLTHGIANRDLGLTRMVKIKMYLPPLERQRQFVSRKRGVEKLKQSYRCSLAQLDSLFASLQHRAFRGEL